MTRPRARVLAVADSDSYLKWAASTLERLASAEGPGTADDLLVDPALVVLRSPTDPTDEQVAAAVSRSRWHDRPPERVTLRALRRLLLATRPDVVLVATTGPAAELLLRTLADLPFRPLLVTGLPGMSVPATELALRYRAGVDVLVVHSHRERDEFVDLAARLDIPLDVVVDRLPFLAGNAHAGPVAPDTTPLRRVVLAPQAKFPAQLDERVELLAALGRLAAARPDLDVVVKLRGLAGDAQTHRERWPFDTLVAEHAELPGVDALRVATGPLDEFLERGTALVTVSSTAVLEALALGLRALVVVGEQGVGEHDLTLVYADSGLVGTLDDVAAGRAFTADPAWLERNYLHPEPDELPAALAAGVAAAHARTLPAVVVPARVGSLPSRVRRRVRLALPRGSRWARSAADVLLRR
ncbi:DUF6716 putative glycosyltransferase [Cellulomonas composti]|uniref:Uncharacterized protein n=1 Tax=Cellulomonas composti TaxID=266130 RepID=A0A511JB43_9CELL|nr:DUF6716 putative glycosyltransferase [Cellulomonas composti]GEL95194.1 hypothetical protein CCO02nite_18520 [Cellulomonas composti]